MIDEILYNVLYCPDCQKSHEHLLAYEYVAEKPKIDVHQNEEDESEYEFTYRKGEILECPSCHYLRFRPVNFIGKNDEPVKYPVLPHHELWHIKPIENFEGLIKSEIFDVYLEAIDTYNAGNFRACGAMIRLIIEAVCITEGLEGFNNLPLRVDKMPIDEKYKTTLKNIIDLGNNVIHYLYPSERKELKAAIKVMETVLVEYYFPAEVKFVLINKVLDEYHSKRPKRKR